MTVFRWMIVISFDWVERCIFNIFCGVNQEGPIGDEYRGI